MGKILSDLVTVIYLSVEITYTIPFYIYAFTSASYYFYNQKGTTNQSINDQQREERVVQNMGNDCQT